MKFNSLRFKIRVFFTATLLTLLVAFGILLIFSIKYLVYKDLDRDLRAKAIQIEAILDAYVQIKANESHPAVMFQNLIYNSKLTSINREMINKLWYADVKALNIQYDYFRLVSSSGKAILFSENFSDSLSQIFNNVTKDSHFSQEFLINISYEGKKYRFMNYPFAFANKMPFSLQIATPTERVNEILMNFSVSVLFVIAFIVLMTVIFGNVLADKTLKPMLSVINVTDTITHKDLSVRIEDTGEYDEIKKLINSFNIMIERLEKSFQHINEFSSHVAHELKTPLAIMKGELELILNDAETSSKDRAVFESILEEVDKLGTIIKDMLLLAKLDYDKSVYNFKKTDMNKFFQDIYEQSLVLTDAKNIDFKLNLTDKKIEVFADDTHLRRLFLNLINNAVKYTPEGGTIEIEVNPRNGQLYTDISDNGEGIISKDLAKIFDKFFRVKKGLSGLNVGLGLSIAMSIAKAHRGNIIAQSTEGKGSVFTVNLPLI